MNHAWSALGCDDDDLWRARCACGWQSQASSADDVVIGAMDEHLALQLAAPVQVPAQRQPEAVPVAAG